MSSTVRQSTRKWASVSAAKLTRTLTRSGPSQPAAPRKGLTEVLPVALVLLAGTILAGVEYARFLETPRALWYSAEHDRNAHYFNGLSLALDLRSLDVIHILRDLDSARVWGPLHAVITGSLMAVCGPDYRLAILPSLAAWVGTALLGFLIARRALAQGGVLAGLTAALFILASPAYRAFAVDIMLESLGAFLTLLVVYCHVRVTQDRTATSARALGLALTALFFLKYNYWLLVLIPLLVTPLVSQPGYWYELSASSTAKISWRRWLKAQARHPLNYLIAVILLALLGVVVSGGFGFTIAGRSISVRSGENLSHAAYVLLFLRALPWWRRAGWSVVRRLDFPMPQLFSWHAVPVAIWFLWPKRLSYFVWYLTRNHGGDVAQRDVGAGALYYWQHLGLDYHVGAWSLAVAAGLALLALPAWRKLRPGGAVVLLVFAFAAILAVRYPSHRSRFMHSWLAAGWVVAGIGFAQLIAWLPAINSRIRTAVGAATVALLVLVHLPGVIQPGHAPEGGVRAARPCLLELSDRYLPALADAHHPAIFSQEPIKFFSSWTYLQRYGRLARLETSLRGEPTEAEFPRAFDQWLDQSACDVFVFLDFPKGSKLYEGCQLPGYRQVPEVLADRDDFHLFDRQDYPQYGCAVTIWKRGSARLASSENSCLR